MIGCLIGCDHSNNELLVRFSSHDLNIELLVCYSDDGLNKEPFDDQRALNHLNTTSSVFRSPLYIVLLSCLKTNILF